MKRLIAVLSPFRLRLLAFFLIWFLNTVAIEMGRPAGADYALSDSIYFALQFFALNYEIPAGWDANTGVGLGRFIAALFAVLAIISLVSSRFVTWVRKVKHIASDDRIVLLGYGQVNRALLMHLEKIWEGPITVVDRNFYDADRIRARETGVLLLEADITEPKAIANLNLEKACRVYVASGYDTLNLEVGTLATEAIEAALSAQSGHIAPRPDRRFGCGARGEVVTVHIASANLMSNLSRAQDIAFALGSGMRFFSIKTATALQLVQKARFVERAADLGQDTPHIVILGSGEVTEALLVQLFVTTMSTNGLPRITVIDPEANKAKARMRAHFPRLFENELRAEVVDLISFIDADVGALSFDHDPVLSPLSEGVPPTAWVFACRDDEVNIAGALRLEGAMQMLAQRPVPIYARAWQGEMSAKGADGGLAQTQLFGQRNDPAVCAMITDTNSDWLALLLHQSYQSEKTPASDQDAYLQDWLALPEHVRRTNRWAAQHLPQKLHDLGFDWRGKTEGLLPLVPKDNPIAVALAQDQAAGLEALDERDPLPDCLLRIAKTEHRRWVIDRALNGWKYSGATDVRSNRRRLHNKMVAFGKLTEAEKRLDLAALSVVFGMNASDFPYEPAVAHPRKTQDVALDQLEDVHRDVTHLRLIVPARLTLISQEIRTAAETFIKELSANPALSKVEIIVAGDGEQLMGRYDHAQVLLKDETLPLIGWLNRAFKGRDPAMAFDLTYLPGADDLHAA